MFQQNFRIPREWGTALLDYRCCRIVATQNCACDRCSLRFGAGLYRLTVALGLENEVTWWLSKN